MILMHHAAFYTCLSSRSDPSRCRYNTHLTIFFFLREKPEDLQFEPHAGIKNSTGCGISLLYLWMTFIFPAQYVCFISRKNRLRDDPATNLGTCLLWVLSKQNTPRGRSTNRWVVCAPSPGIFPTQYVCFISRKNRLREDPATNLGTWPLWVLSKQYTPRGRSTKRPVVWKNQIWGKKWKKKKIRKTF